MDKLKLELIKIRDIKPYLKNTKLHPIEQIEKIRDSIIQFGYNDPIALDENNIIIEGHGRLDALKQINSDPDKQIQIIRLTGLDENAKRAYRIAHNKLNMITEFDLDILKEEFYLLQDTDYFTDTGFEAPEISEICGVSDEAVEDDFEEPKEAKYDIKQGEIWQLGEHRLVCGDCTNKSHVDTLMGEQRANMVLTDPPYNMGFTGSVHSDGSKSYNSKYKEISNDNTSDEQERQFIKLFSQTIRDYNKGAFYIFYYRLSVHKIINELSKNYHGTIIWQKNNHTLSNSDYMSKYEPIVYGWIDEHNFYGGKSNFDIWEIERTQINDLHPTMKPIELCSKAINNSSKKGDIILDLFGGSGSTLIASEQLNRKCFIMELDPYYCSVIIERFEKLTNKQATKLGGKK